MKPRCKFMGRWTPVDLHPSINGRDCYWFADRNGKTTYAISVEKFWGRP